jgi:hypothetical protein
LSAEPPKLEAGDLVKLKTNYVQPDEGLGIVLESRPIEHEKHGYIYHVACVRFGINLVTLPEDDFELISKITSKKG